MGGKRRRFSQEFKDEAVRLAQKAGNVRQVARELGIGNTTLVQWIAQAEKGKSATSAVESEDVRQLRRELEKVREERDILKKAVAFFANEKR